MNHNIRFTKLCDWLSWLESQDISRSPQDALNAVRIVANRLYLLSIEQPVISVTGTNGKGSCVAILESMYHAAGYKVGAYTSPHLINFNERIRLHNRPVTDEQIIHAFNQIDQARYDIPLTYFQFATLAALYIFKSNQIDLFILEIGIGGTWDAVNIVDPTLSVITSIDLDHCELLGETREQIAIQKAGVMRKGKPTICGDLNPPPILLQEADRIGATLYVINKDFFYNVHDCYWSLKTKNIVLDDLPIPQLLLINAATSLMAVHCLNAILPITDDAIVQGLIHTSLPGRFQCIKKNDVMIVFDVAHNPAAASVLFDRIHTLPIDGKKYAICRMLKDKDVLNTLKPFVDYIDEWHLATLEGSRALNAQELEKTLEKLGAPKIRCYDNARFAFENALRHAKAGDLIIIFGSFRLVGQCIHILNGDWYR